MSAFPLTRHCDHAPGPDPFLLMWDELFQVPRVLWACWYDMVVDVTMGMMPQPAAWPGGAR